MSIETWKEKFFHVPADAPSLDTALKRLDHSIRMGGADTFRARLEEAFATTLGWLPTPGNRSRP